LSRLVVQLPFEKAGLERVAEEVRSWVRPHVDEYISFAPTPGPGDSEGGDLFAPEDTGSAR
jgi:hypothetical protein